MRSYSIFLANCIYNRLEQSFDVARNFVRSAGRQINQASRALEDAAQEHFELPVVSHAGNLEVEFLIGFNEGVQASGSSRSPSRLFIVHLECVDFRGLSSQNRQLGGNAFEHDARL